MRFLFRALRAPRAWACERGATAAEFALILPALVLLTIGSINVSIMMFAVSQLHFAVEKAARCVAISSTLCPTPTTYAQSLYKGPTLTGLAFTKPASSCGSNGAQILGTGTYNFVTGLANIPVNLSATACHPPG